jgi:hypothetical protein
VLDGFSPDLRRVSKGGNGGHFGVVPEPLRREDHEFGLLCRSLEIYDDDDLALLVVRVANLRVESCHHMAKDLCGTARSVHLVANFWGYNASNEISDGAWDRPLVTRAPH